MTYGKLTVALVGALVVLSGGSAFALAAGADGEATNGRMVALETNVQQESSQVLVFADDYTPGTSFEVVSRLKQDAIDGILGQTVDDRPVVGNPTDYSGYVVRLHVDGDVPGEYGLVFVDREQGRLMAGSQYEFEADATFFRVDVNLLRTGIGSVDGETTSEAGTPTPETETTEAGTPTPETDTPTPETETPTPTPEAETPTPEAGTPTPEPGGDGADETTPVEQQDGGILSGIADFLGGLFDGGGEGGQGTTAVDST